MTTDSGASVGSALAPSASRSVTPSQMERSRASMRVAWSERTSTTLSDLYDADLRATESSVRAIASTHYVPHPLRGVAYADGVAP